MLGNKPGNKSAAAMRKIGKPTPHKRDGIWYMIRRVPDEFAELDDRTFVKRSTGIAVADDPRAVRAKPIVEQFWHEADIYWQGLRDGQSLEAQRRFDAAVKRARDLGYSYKTAQELSEGPTNDILRRVEALLERNAVDSEPDFAALLGGETRPSLMISDMLTEFKKIQSGDLAKMSPKQKRRWENGKAKALGNFLKVVDDKAFVELTRNDVLDYRQWWVERLEDEELQIDTANKDFSHLRVMHTAIADLHQLDVRPVFARMTIKGGGYIPRVSWDPEYVQKTVLADGALEGLNDEARHIVYVCIETGMRPVEVCSLRPPHIHLDAKIPHVSVAADDRKLKVDHTARDVVLVGVALKAMKLHPEGFPRYFDKNDSLSGAVNKFFRDNGIAPSRKHTLYGFRHTFEDRLTEAEPPEKVQAFLIGHKYDRPRYGTGLSLEQQQRWRQKIAFKSPQLV
jgi:integrase